LADVAHWELQIAMTTMFMPIILSGVGSGLVFPTMSASTLACVERERMGYAASLDNMVRNTGAGIGISLVSNLLISLVSNLLNSRQQVHQSYLAQRFTPFTAYQMSRAGASMPGSQTFNYMHEMVTNQYHGMASVYALIQQQAMLMAYNDIYRDLSLVAAIFIPAFLLLRQAGGRAPAGH
jgi:MFS transporter, DHA2 family, multidrug resistance protein